MHVPLWLWLATIACLLALLAFDLLVIDRQPHRVTIGQAARRVMLYCALAVLFGVGVWLTAGANYAGQFFAGYITEYSLSVDNLFVFLVIMTSFRVPAIHQHRVLFVGIMIALLLRGCLILAGSAVIQAFSAVFYLFGAFLIFTAYRMLRSSDQPMEFNENGVLRLLRKVVPVTPAFEGNKSFITVAGRRMITPMLVVIVAIGTTDLVFALDSIPAVFGLTQQSYLVFAVNVFALMGLRQLYFLIGGLLNRLVYLPIGLSVLLVFVGVKLILQVLRDDWLPFVSGRQSVPVPVPGTELSLVVIAVVLGVTVVASLLRARHDERSEHQEQVRAGVHP
ncbi:MAG TPA: TerC/Alx family metal homeostasis membrane protein [Pseudonocardiaceae bacterium]|nr:TerC/Alx family metal homeostasis membrane protein [Pseudonocardiaceae bacterium]